MHRLLPQGRRHVLGGLAAMLAGGANRASAESAAYSIVVAGPTGGRTDHWADVLVPAVGRALTNKAPVFRQNLGGIDGVTGANQFEARAEPDGTTAMLVPGSAMLSWLVGETRARFEPARWIPLWAGLGGAVLFSRIQPIPGQPFRIAASGPAGPELPVFLALDILGINGVPGTSGPLDGAVLASPANTITPAMAIHAGLQPVMTLGLPSPQGTVGRDPDYPSLPTIFELTADRAPKETLAALRASAMATQLDVGLVLPALTAASSVALWRRACAALQSDPDVQLEIGRTGTRQPLPEQVAACTSSFAGDSSTLLTLRRWLATRYGWQPT